MSAIHFIPPESVQIGPRSRVRQIEVRGRHAGFAVPVSVGLRFVAGDRDFLTLDGAAFRTLEQVRRAVRASAQAPGAKASRH